MARFADLTITAFLDSLASAEPTPGGGTASAITGAMGTALLMMAAGLTRTRGNTEAERVALAEARASLAGILERMLNLADKDSDAFNEVLASYRLPKATEAEQAARKQAIQRALRTATDAPLATLQTVVDAVKHALAIAEHSNRAATSDVRTALELLEAAAAGAAANVEINVVSLEDEPYRKSLAEDVLRLTNALTEDVAASRSALG